MLRRPVLAILSLYRLQSKSALGNYLFQHCCDISHKSSCVQASKKISRELRLKVSRRICQTHESNRVLGSMRLTEPRVHDRHGLYQLFGEANSSQRGMEVLLESKASPARAPFSDKGSQPSHPDLFEFEDQGHICLGHGATVSQANEALAFSRCGSKAMALPSWAKSLQPRESCSLSYVNHPACNDFLGLKACIG